MFRQYAELKSQHPDAVLFFRVGDFYEMFHSDAVEVSRMLNLTLTQRNGIPMCGVPFHASRSYIGRLLKLGRKVAVSEQIELNPDGKGPARREVVEVVTPGTVVDDVYLDDKSNNYLAALAGTADSAGFAYIDLSTGEFRAARLDSDAPQDALRRELARTSPREMIVQESLLETEIFTFSPDDRMVINRLPDWNFDHRKAAESLNRCFGTVNLKAFGIEGEDVRALAAGAVLDYIEDNHATLLPHVHSLECRGADDSVGLDESTIRNLELVGNIRDGGRAYTLLETLDHTKTSAGARALRRRLLQPFPKAAEAESCHARVESLYRDQSLLSSMRRVLTGVGDIERLAARCGMRRANAKDLIAIRNSLHRAAELRRLVGDELLDCSASVIEGLFERAAELADFLSRSLLDDPSTVLTEGRMIREGWDEEVDRLRRIRDEGKGFLDDYAAEERAATGIPSLRIKHNRILGYFIEIGRNQASGAPERFRRRQSLTQVERFSTEKLEDLDAEISSAGERLIERERELFTDVLKTVKDAVDDLLTLGRLISDLDLVQSFAHSATEYGYVKPRMTDEPVSRISGGRHPVVERYLSDGNFVPNDIELDGQSVSFMLVTGPNMAGKSTVLRQAALITLMAQCGAFVPADSALIGTADRIFCRVGASDNLARGESTFLVEMNETANILRGASERSLVIMDEVGRGTGNADGLAIARAVCEYLLENTAPRTLFATHYMELTNFVHPRFRNLSMAVTETGDTIVFPKILQEGPAEASYGIHVAALAGLPETVIRRARFLMESASSASPPSRQPPVRETAPLLFDPREMILDAVEGLDVNELTPLKALQLIARWKEDLDS